jgi:hypothetical protein
VDSFLSVIECKLFVGLFENALDCIEADQEQDPFPQAVSDVLKTIFE